MSNFGSNAPTWAGGIVAGAIVAMVAISILFRGSVHF
jgi:hypothetical protein